MSPRPLPSAHRPSRRRVLSASALSAAGMLTATSCGVVGSLRPSAGGTSDGADADSSSQTDGGGEQAVQARPFDDSLPYVEFGATPGVPVVDVYEDFLCPHCRDFHAAQASELESLVVSGAITLRSHPRPMLDPRSQPAGYSGRAANTAVGAFTQDPILYFRVSDALYENQPGPDGLSNRELVDLAVEAGAERTGIDQVVSDGTHLEWLQRVVEPEASGRKIGTPTVYIDGELWEGDPTATGSLAAELQG